MGQIRRDLPNDEYQAAVGANNPSALNVFATIADLTSSGGIQHGIAAGTNTYTVAIPGVLSYTDGDSYIVRFTNGSDDDSTININGIGVVTLVKQANVQVTGGDILSGQELLLVYDGTNFQCIEVSPNQLFAFVTNDEAIAITKGQPVYAFSATGNRMSVKLAFNTSDATSAQTIGVVYSPTIAAGQTGFIIVQGVISGIDTSLYAPGDQLYLGATAGTLTNVKPYAPNHMVYIGIVERANLGDGQIYIRTQNGYELDELHDVDLITVPPVDGDVLTYNSITSLWEPQATSAIFGKIGITNSSGQYTYYTDLITAASAAVSGDTITLFTNITATSNPVILPNGVDIDLNGFTYTLDTGGVENTIELVPGGENHIFNGKVIRMSGADVPSDSLVIKIDSGASLQLTGVIVENQSGLGILVGGTLYGSWKIVGQRGISVDGVIGGATILDGDINTNAECVVGNGSIIMDSCYLFSQSGDGIIMDSELTIIDSTILAAGGAGIITTVDLSIQKCSIFAFTSQGISTGGAAVNIDNSTITSYASNAIFINGNSSGYQLFNSTYISFTSTTVRIIGDLGGIISGNQIRVSSASGITGLSILDSGTFNLIISNNNILVVSNNLASSSHGMSLTTSNATYFQVTLNTISLFASNLTSYCITATLPTSIYYSNNAFKTLPTVSPVGPNVTQAMINTPDIYGNTLIG